MRKLIVLLVAAAMSLSYSSTRKETVEVAPQSQQQQPHIPKHLIPQIECTNGQKVGYGSGISVAKNTVLTADHVIGKYPTCKVRPSETKSRTKRENTLRPIHRDRTNDFAIFETRNAMPMPGIVINCDPLTTGQTYWLVGYAHGRRQLAIHEGVADTRYFRGRSPDGTETAHLRAVRGLSFHGMSGGPVFDDTGRAIGFVSAVTTDGSNLALIKEFRDTEVCKPLR